MEVGWVEKGGGRWEEGPGVVVTGKTERVGRRTILRYLSVRSIT